MKCEVPYCPRDAKCKGMCLRHYESMTRVGRIVATEIEDWMMCSPEDRWWVTLPKLSKLARNFIGEG